MGDYRPEARVFGPYIEEHGKAIGKGIERGLTAIANALHQSKPLAPGDLPCPTDCGFSVSQIKDMSYVDGWATQCSLILEHLAIDHDAVIGGRP